MKIRVAIAGVSGYSGLELAKIILGHPSMDCIAVVASEGKSGQPLADIHPQLRGLSELVCQAPEMAWFSVEFSGNCVLSWMRISPLRAGPRQQFQGPSCRAPL